MREDESEEEDAGGNRCLLQASRRRSIRFGGRIVPVLLQLLLLLQLPPLLPPLPLPPPLLLLHRWRLVQAATCPAAARVCYLSLTTAGAAAADKCVAHFMAHAHTQVHQPFVSRNTEDTCKHKRTSLVQKVSPKAQVCDSRAAPSHDL